MIHYKTPQEIQMMHEGGIILKKVVKKLLPMIKPGVTTLAIDQEAERLIIAEGARPSFKEVEGYRWTTCLPVNEQVVHTPPSKRVLNEGDVLTLDIGVLYKGFHTDYATMVVVGAVRDPEVTKFLEAGARALNKAIATAKKGKHLGDIALAIQSEVEGAGYCILHALTGHGIGRELHEDPYVLGFVEEAPEKTLILKPGLVIAIEVIYARSTHEIAYEKGDKWSIISSDRSLTACFEKTIAITDQKTVILT